MKTGSLVLLLALSLSAVAHATAEESPAQLLSRADALERKDKKSPEPWLLRGRAHLARGKKRKALGCFTKALKRDPQSAEAYYNRGVIFEAKKKLDEAGNEYQAALKADAKHAGAREAWDRLSSQVSETPEK